MALTVNSFSTLFLKQQKWSNNEQGDSRGAERCALQQEDATNTIEACVQGAAQVSVVNGSKTVSQASSSTILGAMLWQRHVSGVRVICRGNRQAVSGIEFDGYGSSCDNYPHDYMTAAAAIGASKDDVDVFVEKIKKCWSPSVCGLN